MDSRLKRIVILLTVITCLAVLTIVVFANSKTISRRLNNGNVSASVSETSAAETKKDPLQLGNNLNAWKNDETFFDNDAETLAAKLMEELATLNIKAVSEENDIRVRVLDHKGNLKAGENFKVNISSSAIEKKTIQDSNMDGVLYAEGLAAGEYLVSLAEIGDYIVPAEPLTVVVKDHVDYKRIEDISLIVKEKTEAEENIDDLMTISALGYADKNQNKRFGTDEAVAYGVDLSKKNGEIDWKKVYDSGIRFVMLRAGYRGAITGELVADTCFTDNATAALRAGIDVGVYVYSQAVNEKEAVEEASLALEMADGINITYPIAIRFDSAGGVGRADAIDAETRTLVAKAFSDTIKDSNHKSCVYASSNWFETNVDAKKVNADYIWLSEIIESPKPKDYYYDLWQYTTEGVVSGIEGNVTLNVSYIN